MHVLKPGTPQHLEMCQMKIIYRTFHILEIRVWVSTEGVSTKGYLFFPFFFFWGGGGVGFVLFFHFTYRQGCLLFTYTIRVEISCVYTQNYKI